MNKIIIVVALINEHVTIHVCNNYPHNSHVYNNHSRSGVANVCGYNFLIRRRIDTQQRPFYSS